MPLLMAKRQVLIQDTMSAGQTGAITGLAFQPKILITMAKRSLANAVSGAHTVFNIGFVADHGGAIEHASGGFTARDNEIVSVAAGTMRDSSIIGVNNSGGTEFLLRITAFTGDGFTWILDNPPETNIEVVVFCIGSSGSVVLTASAGVDAVPAGVGPTDFDIDPGFTPDLLFAFSLNSLFTSMATFDGRAMVVGWTNGIEQVSGGFSAAHGVNPSNNRSHIHTGKLLAIPSSTADSLLTVLAFKEFLSPMGFRLTKESGSDASAMLFGWLAIKGISSQVGVTHVRTDSADIPLSVPDFDPVGIFCQSAHEFLVSGPPPLNDINWCFGGAASETEQHSLTSAGADAVSPSDTWGRIESGFIMRDAHRTSADTFSLQAALKMKSKAANLLTLEHVVNGHVEALVPYVILGPNTDPAPPPPGTGTYIEPFFSERAMFVNDPDIDRRTVGIKVSLPDGAPATGEAAGIVSMQKNGGAWSTAAGIALAADDAPNGVYKFTVPQAEIAIKPGWIGFKYKGATTRLAGPIYLALDPPPWFYAGTLAGGAVGTATFAADAPARIDRGSVIRVISGAGAPAMAIVASYVFATKIATFEKALNVALNNTSLVVVEYAPLSLDFYPASIQAVNDDTTSADVLGVLAQTTKDFTVGAGSTVGSIITDLPQKGVNFYGSPDQPQAIRFTRNASIPFAMGYVVGSANSSTSTALTLRANLVQAPVAGDRGVIL